MKLLLSFSVMAQPPSPQTPTKRIKTETVKHVYMYPLTEVVERYSDKIGMVIGHCGICNGPLTIKSVQSEKNFGRVYSSCPERGHDNFQWVDRIEEKMVKHGEVNLIKVC